MIHRPRPARTLLVAGPAGSGKSTLGRALAADLDAALLDLDTMTNPMLERLGEAGLFGSTHWNDEALRSLVRPARYAALRAALAEQPGRSVAVAPWTAELTGGEEWADVVAALGGEPGVVWLRASSALLAERRAHRGLDRDAHIVDSDAAPSVPHIAVDAALPVQEQVARVRAALDGPGG